MDIGASYLLFFAGFGLALALAWIATPLAIRLARRFKVLDVPGHRKQHTIAIPRLGGVAVFTGILAAFLLLCAASPMARAIVMPHLRQLLYLGAGMLVLFLTGLVDDFRGLRPRAKVAFQGVAAALAIYGGFQFQFFRGEADGGSLLGLALNAGLTVFWIIGTTNAVNLIDGLDGLASGITGIALVTLGFISIFNGHLATALAAFVCAGAVAGFLWHNRHPARIFLGDSGSLLLGFLLAALSIEGTQQGSLVASLVGPLCLLYIPLLDTVLAMVRRALKGLPFSFPDNHHIHHRLLRKGIAHPQVVFILWGAAFAVAEAAIVLRFVEGRYQGLVANGLAVVLLSLTLRHLANLEVSESLRMVRNINRRKRTPRGKVLALRRELEAAARLATANSLLESLRRMGEQLEVDTLHLTMSPASRDWESLTVSRWNRHLPEGGSAGDWKSAPPRVVTAAASASYAAQPGTVLTVELGRAAWKERRRSEDIQLWARILVDKLATLEQLSIFCPGEAETLYSLSEIR